MLVTLAASVAGVGEAHEPRREFVAEISLQDSVLDEDGFLRRLAFIIHVQGATAPRHRAVVDDGALRAGNSFADQTSECRGLLTIEIGFQAVTHSLMQQNPRPSRTQHDFHVASWGFACIELQNRLARGLFGEELRSLVVFSTSEKEVECHTSASA